jgi:hypothetical protein
MGARILGGGLEVGGVVVPAYPDATLTTALDAARLANTAIEGMLVKCTWANNNEVGVAATGEPFDGILLSAIPDNEEDYILSVRMYRFSDKSGNRHPVHDVGEYLYTGSPALQDAVVVDTTAYNTVKPATTYGDGAVWAIDSANAEVQVFLD